MRAPTFRASFATLILLACSLASAQPQVTFRYFYDGNGQLFRVLDSSGNLVEYVYDLSGNPTQINRTSVAPGSLSILNVVPLSALPGQTVTIYGQNFSSSVSGNIVMFNGVAATVISASSTALVVQVPAGALTGPVTVTVNGVTASSGSLRFTVLGLPVISSISPTYGGIGQLLTGVIIQGTNLDGAQFDLQGGGQVNVTNLTSTQATVDIKVGPTMGAYTMIANADSGVSTSQPTAGNTFVVFQAPGNNFADAVFSVFNAAGASPLYPAVNEADQAFSVFNSAVPPGTPTATPDGSNEAFQLFSTKNLGGPPTPPTALVLAPVAPGGLHRTAGVTTLRAGESITVSVRPAALMRNVNLSVNGAPLASSPTGSLTALFTAPWGVESIEFQASGRGMNGAILEALAQGMIVAPDEGREISGRVVGPGSEPMADVTVLWLASGLAAEYFRFDQDVSGIPDLTGLTPSRLGFVTAVNYPNPLDVFGRDPMGAGVGGNYAARFRGKLRVDAAGDYRFRLKTGHAARLMIDGKRVLEGQTESVATLAQGAHDLEIVYYQATGAPALQLLWSKPGGEMGVVPPEVLEAEAPMEWRARTGKDGRFVLKAPAAIGPVELKLAAGVGSIEVDR